MNRIFLVFALLLIVITGHVLADDQPIEDIEDVKTPLTLPELLPEGGIDTVNVDYWIETKSLMNGVPRGRNSMTHWTIKPEKGQLVFQSDMHTVGANNYRRIKTTVYSSQGKLQSYRYRYYLRGRKMMVTEGEVEDNAVVLKTTRYDSDGNVQDVQQGKTLSLKPYEEAIPSEWQPLVFAYHIRKGSLGYRIDRADISRSNSGDTSLFEDVGSEQVEFDGKQARAHLLVGKRDNPADSRSKQPSNVRYLVLPNGEHMSVQWEIGEYAYISKRISAEQAKKLLPDDVAEDDDAAGD
jgi:hypothetical protein